MVLHLYFMVRLPWHW